MGSADGSGAFPCQGVTVNAPSEVVGYTADFAIQADTAFTLYVDDVTIGAGSGGPPKVYRLTAPIYAGSVIAVEVSNTANEGVAAIKLRYDIDGTEHTIDDTWLATSTRITGFQLQSFDDSKWYKPVDSTRKSPDGFDPAVGWKGIGSSPQLFLRRHVPMVGATS